MDQFENNLRKALREPEPPAYLAGKVMAHVAQSRRGSPYGFLVVAAALVGEPGVVLGLGELTLRVRLCGAVELARQGRAEALMKGSLHSDELLGEVMKRDTGLRTARRISQCFIMDVPDYAEALIITDAAVNIAPTLEEKADIVRNAIDLAHSLGVTEVRVAILSAVETVNPSMPSTIEAAALCKMADRGQITGGTLDGPLALDNAISPEAARIKGIRSPVAGRANVLVAPDLEAANMLAKSLSFLAKSDAAGIVLGARVPIILTSRADSVTTRLASCAVASLVAKARREDPKKAIA